MKNFFKKIDGMSALWLLFALGGCILSTVMIYVDGYGWAVMLVVFALIFFGGIIELIMKK